MRQKPITKTRKENFLGLSKQSELKEQKNMPEKVQNVLEIPKIKGFVLKTLTLFFWTEKIWSHCGTPDDQIGVGFNNNTC